MPIRSFDCQKTVSAVQGSPQGHLHCGAKRRCTNVLLAVVRPNAALHLVLSQGAMPTSPRRPSSAPLVPVRRGGRPYSVIARTHCARGNPYPLPMRPHMKKNRHPAALFHLSHSLSSLRTAMNASVGTCTVPRLRIFFLPSFCFSSSFFFRVMSPP